MPFKNLSTPILQAPIGSAATTDLAAAVSNAGGMGSLAMTWTEPDAAAQLVEQLNAETAAPYFVNFVLSFPLKSFDAVIEAGVPIITLSWGHNRELVDRAHRNGIPVGMQVGSVEGARRAIDDGVDFLICQGVEAGGHVQSTTSLTNLLPQVAEQTRDVPVVAAGGLADSQDIKWALDNGAAAAMLGTRFIATKESSAHPLYKDAIIKARSADTAYTLCFDGGWPYAAHRVLRNNTLKNWEAAGCPPKGLRPGEGDTVATDTSGSKTARYDDMPALESMTGDVLDCCLYAGLGVNKINRIESAKELVVKLWQDCQ